MNTYLSSITPDSLSGILFAFEGITCTVVLLNGPTGCKFYHSSTADSQTIRLFEFDPLNYPEKWYFGQPRVPCTFLDSNDYIYGSKDKLEEALCFLRDNVAFDLLCIVNSPGAALIGDDLRGISARLVPDLPVVVLETPGFSSDVCTGYDAAAVALIEQLPIEKPERILPKTVNLLGLSIFHKYYSGDSEELRRLLGLCGITVNCVLCADCSLKTVASLPAAELNIVIHPEYALKTAHYLKTAFGTPYYVCPGPPVGFSATEAFLRDVCAILGADAQNALTDSERARARAYSFLSRLNSLKGLPKGVHFALEGTYSELYAYTDFLICYFGMIPECLSVLNPHSDCARDRLLTFLHGYGLSDVLDREIAQTRSELVFGSGNTIAMLKLKKHVFSGIETALPSLGYTDVVPKTHLGVRGALLLTELVLNGLIF